MNTSLTRYLFPLLLIILAFISGSNALLHLEAQEWTLFTGAYVGPAPTSGECSIWSDQYRVPLGGRTTIYMWWEDLGYYEYYVIIYEDYPNGGTRRYPPTGYYGPYPAPGDNRALMGYFIGDKEGEHHLYFQVYTPAGRLLCTSNTISIDVIKEKEPSSISLSVSPTTVEKGETVLVTGSITPRVSTSVTIKISSSKGVIEKSISAVDGYFSLSFSLTEIGTYIIQASWSGNEDYVGAASKPVSLKVIPKKYPVDVSVLPSELSITIDGRNYGGSASFEWEEGSKHTLSVSKIIEVKEGVRYVFLKWSDGTTSPSRSIIVSGPASYQAVFSKEFYVDVETAYGDVQGVGWHSVGESVRIKLSKSLIQFENDTRMVFSGWSGDATGTDTEVWIKVDKPYKIRANWKKQYKVATSSKLASISIEGGEWQNAVLGHPSGLISLEKAFSYKMFLEDLK